MGKNKTKNIRQAVENELTFGRVDATDITVINMNGEVNRRHRAELPPVPPGRRRRERVAGGRT